MVHSVIARATAATDIDLASIAVNGDPPVDFEPPDPSDLKVQEAEVATDERGLLLFAFELRTRFVGISWSLTLTEKGSTKPKYTSHPNVTNGMGKGEDAGLVDFD